jgi:hypothetical protein
MKNIFLVALFITFLISCTPKKSEEEIKAEKIAEQKERDSGRIKVVDFNYRFGMSYEIIEVDGIQFLTTTEGGIIRLDKK